MNLGRALTLILSLHLVQLSPCFGAERAVPDGTWIGNDGLLVVNGDKVAFARDPRGTAVEYRLGKEIVTKAEVGEVCATSGFLCLYNKRVCRVTIEVAVRTPSGDIAIVKQNKVADAPFGFGCSLSARPESFGDRPMTFSQIFLSRKPDGNLSMKGYWLLDWNSYPNAIENAKSFDLADKYDFSDIEASTLRQVYPSQEASGSRVSMPEPSGSVR